jgi:hypothetical protein
MQAKSFFDLGMGSVANLLFQSFSHWGEVLSGGGLGVQGQAF